MERFIRESPGCRDRRGADRLRHDRLYHDHVLVKEPGTQQRTPWHQDQPYYNVDGVQNASMWFPVDPVDRSATLEFIAGTHRGPWFMPRTFLDDQAEWFPDGSLAELPDFAADRATRPWRDARLGTRTRRRRVLQHAHGPRIRRRRPAATRRRCSRCAILGDDMVHAPPPMDDLATVRRSRRRTRRRASRWIIRCSRCCGPIRRTGRSA